MTSEYCSPNCSMKMIGNGICDVACYTEACSFDAGDCNSECSPGCNITLLSNSECDYTCNTYQCTFDNQMCLCSPGCYPEYLKNNICNKACDNTLCVYDGGDCSNSGNSYTALLTIIGFVIVSVSILLIILVIICYLKRRYNYLHVSNNEASSRISIGELNDRMPEVACPAAIIGETCAICLEDFQSGIKIRKLECEHWFHSECILQWLLLGHSRTCPLCAAVVFQ